jgi:hypothetical protein
LGKSRRPLHFALRKWLIVKLMIKSDNFYERYDILVADG